MSDDRLIRYNRDFLNNHNIKNDIDEYAPKFHIYPHKGLINDPNCIFYLNNNLYVFFQHHPANNLHGLKTMSLAKTNNLIDFDYHFMVNKPINDFESHGVYSGNAIVVNNKVISFYTGNQRDDNWIRTSSVIKAEYDLNKNEFVNKTKLFDQYEFKKYSEHFRDPFVFEYKNKFYMLLGSQTIENENGVILLFELNNDFNEYKLIKEIHVDDSLFRMIECPNIVFDNNDAYLIYCPQYKENKTFDNPDICVYSKVDINKLIDDKTFEYNIQSYEYVDYGLEYYAPQCFKINNDNYIIGWVGVPTNLKYLETKNGWVHMLSMIKKIEFKDNKMTLVSPDIYKNSFSNSKDQFVKYQQINLVNNKSIKLFDNDQLKLDIELKNNKLVINRICDYYPYDNKKVIDVNNNKVDIEIYIDNSIVEINIDKKYWYTSRIYFDKQIKVIESE